jgi:hypothetical protein
VEFNLVKIERKESISLNSIPGLPEAMESARKSQFKTRETALLGLSDNLCGFKVRTMKVIDYVLLERGNSPFLNRTEPTMADLSFFLWELSPQYGLWRCGSGWRGLVSPLQPVAAFFYARKANRAFGKNIPDSSEQVVLECFKYVNSMFFDAPASVSGCSESCTCYLTGWFDILQSEYGMTTDEIWEMGLPELFQRLKAITYRKNPTMPQFNKTTDGVRDFVVRGLREKKFTFEDLKNGKVEIPLEFN